MAKLTIPAIESGYLSGEALNQILEDIQTAFENTVSRDGTSPNQMEADFDLNGYVILNSGESDDPNRVITYEELIDAIAEASSGLVAQTIEVLTAIQDQTTFVFSEISYTRGTNNLGVYVNGLRQWLDVDYTETDSTTIEFLVGLNVDDEVVGVTNEFFSTIAVEAHTHPWSQITNRPDYTTRWPTYAEVTGKPAEFTPEAHEHDAADITTGRLADARRGVYVQAAEPAAPETGDLWAW